MTAALVVVLLGAIGLQWMTIRGLHLRAEGWRRRALAAEAKLRADGSPSRPASTGLG